MMFTHTADGPQPHTWHNPAGPVIFATSRHKPVNQARPHSYPLCIEPKSKPYEYSAFGLELPPAAGAEWTDRTRLYLPGTTEWRVPLATAAVIEIRKKATSRHEMSTAV